MIDKLLEKYWDESMLGQPDLEAFTRKLAEGEYGEVAPEDIAAFLREVETITIANIETKASEGGPFALRRDELIDETRRQVERLVTLYAGPQT